jgi:hypothetical protein
MCCMAGDALSAGFFRQTPRFVDEVIATVNLG